MKILIVINHMQVGGIQKSLLELLKVLSSHSEYDVSLFCCKASGAFLGRIPHQIKVLPENEYAVATEIPLFKCKKLGIKYYLFRMISSLWSKYFTKALPAVILCKLIGKIGEDYDVAISYSQPIGDYDFCNFTNEIVLNCIQANYKITFVHCDFSVYGGNTKRNRKLYEKFDRIAVVSKSVGKRFLECMPKLSNKIQTVYNFCDCNEIEYLSTLDPLIYSKTTFVTVARLSKEKGILRCISIFDRLKKNGYDFEWHIIGDGLLRDAIEKKIKHYSLDKNIILEGEQLNPYRYIKNADFFFLPSLHEAAPIVFDEAITLGIPVLTTKTLSAVEMIEEKHAGLVCENNEIAIYNMLHYIMTNSKPIVITDKPNIEIRMQQFKNLCNQKKRM